MVKHLFIRVWQEPEFSSHLLQIRIMLFYMWDIYKHLFLYTLWKSGYHFWSKWAPQEQEKWKVHFLPPLGTEDNAKFGMSSVLKMSVVFFSTRRYLYLRHSWKIYRVMTKNVKTFNFLFHFSKLWKYAMSLLWDWISELLWVRLKIFSNRRCRGDLIQF